MNAKFMAAALDCAKSAAESGEVPVGAVVVKDGEIISSAHNRRESDGDATAHAEILAIRAACERLKSWRLSGCEIYVTLEPCPMCAGAIINARIDTVVFGAYDQKGGAVCSVTELFKNSFNHHPQVFGGVMERPCADLLTRFFAARRQSPPAE